MLPRFYNVLLLLIFFSNTKTVEYQITESDSEVLVQAHIKREVIGYAVLNKENLLNPNHWNLHDIRIISPNDDGKGIGSTMIKEAEGRLSPTQFSVVPAKSVEGFYKKNGFKPGHGVWTKVVY